MEADVCDAGGVWCTFGGFFIFWSVAGFIVDFVRVCDYNWIDCVNDFALGCFLSCVLCLDFNPNFDDELVFYELVFDNGSHT